MNNKALLKPTLLALAVAGSASTFAQSGGNADSPNVGLIEILVTAQRREQSLQDAALPVQAINQEALTRQGMETAQDLGLLSPALGISAGGGPLTSIFLRGVGNLTVNPLTDSAIAQNIDGVYLGRSSGAAGQSLFDLERVELLKGPQGTLYGRNATGGVINYIPQKPIMGETSGFIQAEAGEYDKLAFQGAVNLDAGDNVAIRLSGNVLNRDGFSDDGTNDADTMSLRAQILFEPSDRLSVRIAADYSENNAKGPGGDLRGTYSNTPGMLTDFTPTGLPINSGPTNAAANAIRGGTLHTPSFAFYQPINADDLYQNISFTGVMAEINYQTDAGTLTFIPAYRESDQDYAFSGPGFSPAKTDEQNEQLSFEARFATDLDGALNGIIGAFYIDEEIQTSTVFAQNYTSPIQNYDNGGDSWAIFGQATLDLSDTFRLNAGIRYTEDSKFADGISDTFVTFCGGAPASPFFTTPPASFANGCQIPGRIPAHAVTSDRDGFIADLVARGEIAPDSVATIPNTVPGPPPIYRLLRPGLTTPQQAWILNVGEGLLQSQLDYSEVTYRIGAEWDWGDSNLLYAGFETGYRAGGVDLSLVSPTYEPEYIDAFTIGSKNRFLDNTLQINAELFLWKYDDQQVTYFTTLDGASAFPIANADSTIQGLDIDVIWAASDSTTIYGNVQFLDSTYDSLNLISDPARGRFGCASSGVSGGLESFDCSGQSLLFSPEFGMDLGINHIINLNNYDLSLTADASYRDEQGTNFLFLEDTISDAYVTLNLEAALTPSDADWSLSLYMRNATDERFFMNTNTNNRGLTYNIFNPPRVYGARFNMSF